MNIGLVAAWHSVHAICSARVALSMGLHQPRECVKFGLRYLSEKVALSLIAFAGYMRQILYMYTDFQFSEWLHGGPAFSGNYLIDYTIGFIIHYTIITS